MITAYLLTAGEKRVDLPPLLSWRLKRTGAVPCDSFEATCPWDAGAEPVLETCCRLIVEDGTVRRFTGVLDECRLRWDGNGGRLSVSGRGLCALLLDNEAESHDYQLATPADILRDHVSPYGLPVGRLGTLYAVPGFSVSSGQSEWDVLYSFARYHNGVSPLFDAWGSLILDPAYTGRRLTADDRTGFTAVTWQDRRYGVWSEVWVRDRGSVAPAPTQKIVNEGFRAQGGQRRRVLTMPAKSAWQAMRYSGQFQLDRSYEERFRLELTVPVAYFCDPGDVLSVSLSKPALRGTWRVLETDAALDEKGPRVKLTLG